MTRIQKQENLRQLNFFGTSKALVLKSRYHARNQEFFMAGSFLGIRVLR